MDSTPEIVPMVAKMVLLEEIAILYVDLPAPTTVVPTVIMQYVIVQQRCVQLDVSLAGTEQHVEKSAARSVLVEFVNRSVVIVLDCVIMDITEQDVPTSVVRTA